MKEILFVAPTKIVYENALENQRIYGFDNIEIVRGMLAEGLEIAKEYYARGGVEVIISRGGTYNMIRDAIPVPAVEIKVSASDCIAAYRELKAYDEKIAVVGYSNVINDFRQLEGIIPDNLTYMTISSQDELRGVIESCRKQGITKIVGDVTVRDVAKSLNCTGMLIESQMESILLAMQQAESVLEAAKAQIRKRDEIKSVIDSVAEAVFYTDTNGNIRLKNKTAEQFMKRMGANDETSEIQKLLPVGELREEEVSGKVYTVNGLKYIVSVTPIYDEGRYSGLVFSLQRSEDISDFEYKLRRSADKKGFVAKYHFEDIVHVSPVIDALIERAEKFAAVESPILISGESGTGKELLCQSIHNVSTHRNGPFVAINCAAISPSLIESELFGYEAGAFTNAHRNGKAGIFELAHNGTLFLDEISEIPPEMQSRLLRAIQEKQVMRIGGEKIIPVNVRLICASNKDLRKMMNEGKFRADLYFRISILKLSIPSLNERAEDIIPLAEFFLNDYAEKYNIKALKLSEADKSYLQKRRFIGNIRELEGLMEESTVLNSFENIYTEQEMYVDEGASASFRFDESRTLEENDDAYIRYIYGKTGGSVEKTTGILGISRTTLWRKLNAGT